MNKYLLTITITLLSLCQCTTDTIQEHGVTTIIPKPMTTVIKDDKFVWKSNFKIIVQENNPELQSNATLLQDLLRNATGCDVLITDDKDGVDNAIVLQIDNKINGNEAYQIDIDKRQIEIKASTNAGIFYGIQSLIQLLPADVYKKGGLKEGFILNSVHIEDAPRFSYRGMHLDVSRNFIEKADVKKFIDLMAIYKLNRFHWHLTDGAGWRIEIKKYPLLTQKGAFRAQSTWKEFWNEGGRKFVDEGTPNSYGGYYTQEDIKEIVAYATSKHITIIPEIEMPAHSEEVFVAYPEFSCSGIPYKDSDFCAGNEKTFTFIEDVLNEVIELFPSQYIHIGGDEAGKDSWKTCVKCQGRIKTEHLKSVDELQSYFIKRVSLFLKSKGRNLIGWDEIIDGGLAKDATIMLWRDTKTAIHAAQEGHDIIMTPGSHCYFDFYQANPATEVEAIGGYLPLRKVYSFEVVADSTLSKHFIGGQANLWTEYIPTYKHVEYMVFPRILALSEAVWSTKSNRNWTDFKYRLQDHFPRLDLLDVNYHKPTSELEMFTMVDTIKKQIKIHFDSEQYKPTIRYSTDGNIPTEQSELYTDTIYVNEPKIITASIFRNGLTQSIFKRNISYHLGIGKKVIYGKSWTSYPAGGETALVDGLLGGLTYSDGLWQGFTSDLDITIDLGAVIRVNTFEARFMQLIGPGVYMPNYVEVLGSLDGNIFESILRVDNDIPKENDRLCFKDFHGNLQQKEYRYVKVFAKNQAGFIFTDEIVIN